MGSEPTEKRLREEIDRLNQVNTQWETLERSLAAHRDNLQTTLSTLRNIVQGNTKENERLRATLSQLIDNLSDIRGIDAQKGRLEDIVQELNNQLLRAGHKRARTTN